MRLAASCPSYAEARMVCDRLREAGIGAAPKGDMSAESRDLGPYEVYVEDADLDRAHAVLRDAASVSEAELVRAEEEDAAQRFGPPKAE
jgi:hypothetical protein